MEVRLYGILAEKAGQETVQVDANDVDSLREGVKRFIPELDSMSYAVAINRELTQANRSLTDSDEVALLPPFAGG